MSEDAIEARLTDVRRRIADAAERANRAPDEITLVAVTKGRTVDEARALYDLGIRHFGENRVPEAESKIAALPNDIVWHMVGYVQRRKAPAVIRLFRRVDSVDRVELADTLNRRAESLDVTMDVLLEVNISGETAKHGMAPSAVRSALETVSGFANIRVMGLMTMAPFCEDAESVRPVFRDLRNLTVENNLPVVSMGMSGDFEVAIEEGATEVRIGTALFV